MAEGGTQFPPSREMEVKPVGKLAAFQIPNFRILFAGRVTSNMARSMRVFLRAWMVLELTDSPLMMGLVISSLSWPMLVMPFVGGVMADRMDRRTILKWTESLLVLLWAFVALLVFFGAYDIGPGFLRIEWWYFMLTSFVSGLIQSIGRPGHQAMIGSIVDKERLQSAVALDAVSDTWPRVAGPAIAAIIIALIGGTWRTWGPWLFAFTAAGQLVTAITIFMLHWQPTMDVSRTRERRGAFGDFLEGLKLIKNEPVLMGLVALGITFMLFAGGAGFLLPVFARDVLGLGQDQGAAGLGVLMTVQTLGASLGAMAIVWFSSFRRRGYLLLFVAIFHSLTVIAFSQSTIFLVSAFLIIGGSSTMVFFRTVRRTLMQMLAPDHMRGRVMSMDVFQQGLNPIGILIWGGIAEFMRAQYGLAQGTQNTWLIGGILYGVITVLFFTFMPALRRFR